VRSEQELTWLAPGTAPPLTPEKVIAWGRANERRFMLWREGTSLPIAYAELNNMPDSSDQMWIGHFLVDPAHRERRNGTRFAQALLACAFQRFGARDVLLVVFPDNTGAIRCYQRAGMTALGHERKRFEATGREHVFLRMGITGATYREMVASGQIPSDVPVVRSRLTVLPIATSRQPRA
jgi:RimJ/RimL family protein N-acetyltransferase